MPKVKLRKGDHVVVLAGKDRGKTGQVLKVLPKDNRVIVQGVNIIRRHQRQTPQQDGGIISKETSIDISNLAIEDPTDGKPTKIGFKTLKDGRKVRFSRRTGETIDA